MYPGYVSVCLCVCVYVFQVGPPSQNIHPFPILPLNQAILIRNDISNFISFRNVTGLCVCVIHLIHHTISILPLYPLIFYYIKKYNCHTHTYTHIHTHIY